MAARKPTKLNAPATTTAIQLAQNGTSMPFKATVHPITIRINCRSAIRAKMAAASVQKVLMVIAHLRWPTGTCSFPEAKKGRNRRGGHSPRTGKWLNRATFDVSHNRRFATLRVGITSALGSCESSDGDRGVSVYRGRPDVIGTPLK